MTWFEIKEKSLKLKFKSHNTYNTTKHTRISFRLPKYIEKYYWSIVAATITLRVSQPSLQTEILTQDLEGDSTLVGTANSHTFPYYGNTKFGWREWRKSSLSQVASCSVWLFHWTLKNLMVLRLMTWSFWSKTLIGCLGYVKSASSGATCGSTTSMGAFKHFFSYDTWKISWTPVNNGVNSNL
jgi:hypothetical protein